MTDKTFQKENNYNQNSQEFHSNETTVESLKLLADSTEQKSNKVKNLVSLFEKKPNMPISVKNIKKKFENCENCQRNEKEALKNIQKVEIFEENVLNNSFQPDCSKMANNIEKVENSLISFDSTTPKALQMVQHEKAYDNNNYNDNNNNDNNDNSSANFITLKEKTIQSNFQEINENKNLFSSSHIQEWPTKPETLKNFSSFVEEMLTPYKPKESEKENDQQFVTKKMLKKAIINTIEKPTCPSGLTKSLIETDKPKTITILLLGESGVGKSTFINGFANYLMHSELDEAANDLICLIESRFIIYDEETYEMKKVNASPTASYNDLDRNENFKEGESSTQKCRCYVFPAGNFTIKIIDTPGIGDTRGVDADAMNLRNLLNFISYYKEVHAICVLMKPNNARASVLFNYCILQLLTHLNKSASNNIVFLFTNARSTFYRPGDSGPSLINILNKIRKQPPYVSIKFNKENTFCFDNEAFRFLVATKNNISFSHKEKEEFENSWKRSVSECQRMMEYIVKLKPHNVQDTISINNARTTILQLTKPLGDISKNIADNVNACEKHRKKIFEWKGDIEDLKKNLYTPSVDIKSIPLEKPMTVCGDPECCESVNVNGTIKTHYNTICHKECYLEITDGNVIGNAGLLDCKAFNKYVKIREEWLDIDGEFYPDTNLSNVKTNENGQVWGTISDRIKSDTCVVENCGHSYQVHLHIFEETQIRHTKVMDETKNQKIKDTTQVVEVQQTQIKLLEDRIKELNKEQDIITKTSAKFACFLKNNALTAINDAFEEYLKHLIKNEESAGSEKSIETIESLKKMLENHEFEKKIILNAMKDGSKDNNISAEDIENSLSNLFKLKFSGPLIKEHLQLHKNLQKQVHSKQKEIKLMTKNNLIANKANGWFYNNLKKLGSKIFKP